jgi:hypothetical protein
MVAFYAIWRIAVEIHQIAQTTRVAARFLLVS